MSEPRESEIDRWVETGHNILIEGHEHEMWMRRNGHHAPSVRGMLDTVEQIHTEGEPLSTEDLDLHTVDDALEMVELWRAAKRQADAARQVLTTCGTRLAELLGDGGAAAIGDNIVRYGLGRTEKCIDPEGVAAYLQQAVASGEVQVGDVVNPTYVKRSWMSDAVRDTFYQWVDDDAPKVTVVPRDRAPKFLLNLSDGEVRKGKM